MGRNTGKRSNKKTGNPKKREIGLKDYFVEDNKGTGNSTESVNRATNTLTKNSVKTTKKPVETRNENYVAGKNIAWDWSNPFNILLLILLAAALVIAGIVGWKQYNVHQSDKLGTGTPPASGLIIAGEGNKNKVDVYVDFHCPVCKQLDGYLSQNMKTWAQQHNAEFVFHPLSILDKYSVGERYSSRSANASLCVAAYNPDRVEQYIKILYDNQPYIDKPKSSTNKKLAYLAGNAGAGKNAKQCIMEEKFADTVLGSTALNAPKVKNSVPVVFVNGEMLSGFKDYNELQNGITKAIEALN